MNICIHFLKGINRPVDGKTELPQIVRISTSFKIAIFAVAGGGVFLALLFLALNLALRNQRFVENANDCFVLHCVWVDLSCNLYHQHVSEDNHSTIIKLLL